MNEKDAGPIYENTQDSNTWNLDLDIGQYQADITDSCGQVIENYLIDIRDAYTFSVDILFEGFQCFDDNSGRVAKYKLKVLKYFKVVIWTDKLNGV